MNQVSQRRILFVCTANICRSPTAELLSRHHFGEDHMAFRSAGFLRAGKPCADEIVRLLGRVGIDGTRHRSYRVDTASIAAADLILAMEGSHIQRLTEVDPGAFVKAVPLREVASVLEQGLDRPSVEELLAVVNRNRDPRSYLDSRWDVEDPYGGRARGYRKAVMELDDLVRLVFSRVW